MKKSAAALAMIAVSALALSACSSTSSDSATAPAAGGSTTLNWAMWSGSEAETASWQKVADMVTEKYPDITLNLQPAAWPDYWTKLPTTLAGNDAPCLVGIQMARTAQFADSLTPLDDLLSSAGVDPADFDPGIMKALQGGGKQLALPYDLGPYVMFYNRDMFKAAGLSDPANGWSTDDFLTDAKALTTGGKFGYAASSSIDYYQAWLPGLSGMQLVDDKGVLHADDPAAASALDWYAGLVTKEKVAEPIVAGTGDADQQAFLAGNAAMLVSGPWAMINIKDQAQFDVGIVTVPAGPEGVVTLTGGSGFGISKSCKEQDAAMKALSVLTGPDAENFLGSAGRAYPARTAQQSVWYASAVDGAQATLEMANKSALPYLTTVNWTQDSLNWGQGVVPVINGEASAESFLKTLQAQSK